jgi:sugar phosphate isomerase/epimerase
MALKLAVQEQMLPGENLIEKFDFATAAGFDAIELRGAGDLRFRERLPELRAARAAGVVMPSVCVMMDHFIGDFDADLRRDAIDNMKSLLEVIVQAGGFGAITPAAYGLFSLALPPFTPPRSPEEDRKVLLGGLVELGEHAAAEGAVLLLEPLNRYEDHMVNTLDQAVSLCREVGLPSVKVMGDFFHMSIEEVDLAASIGRAEGWLGHMQLGDSNRLEPGAGHLDFGPSLRALEEIGFDGYLAMECGLSGDPAAVLPRVAQYLRSQARPAR